MTQLAGRQTMDTPSTEGNCVYAATPLGGSPYQATTIRVGSQMLEGYTSLSPLTNAPSTKVNPINPLPCAPGVRKIVPVKNTTVFFENKLFPEPKAAIIPILIINPVIFFFYLQFFV